MVMHCRRAQHFCGGLCLIRVPQTLWFRCKYIVQALYEKREANERSNFYGLCASTLYMHCTTSISELDRTHKSRRLNPCHGMLRFSFLSFSVSLFLFLFLTLPLSLSHSSSFSLSLSVLFDPRNRLANVQLVEAVVCCLAK